LIDRADKEVVKKSIYAVRTDDGACAIKRIHVLDNIVLLLSKNPDSPLVLAPTTDLNELITGCIIWFWQSLKIRIPHNHEPDEQRLYHHDHPALSRALGGCYPNTRTPNMRKTPKGISF